MVTRGWGDKDGVGADSGGGRVERGEGAFECLSAHYPSCPLRWRASWLPGVCWGCTAGHWWRYAGMDELVVIGAAAGFAFCTLAGRLCTGRVGYHTNGRMDESHSGDNSERTQRGEREMEALQLQAYDEWLVEHMEDLMVQYPARVVAIHEGKIIFVGEGEVDVYQQVREAGLEPMPLVFRVPREEDVQSIL